MEKKKSVARRAVGLFNLKKFPARAKFVLAWADQRVRQRALSNASGLAADLTGAGIELRDWCARRRNSGLLHVSAAMPLLASFTARHPNIIAVCLRDADQILAHRFDLLGSGPYQPVCSTRSKWRSGYQPIDWALDPVRNLRFPEGFAYREWDLYRDRPGNADIKYPWELARCQHFLTLAQAWQVSSQARYAQEILNQIRDFDEGNPIGRGVNWTCTMDVALRGANWAIALDLIGGCSALDPAELFAAYGSLFDHGRFIRANLENTYEITSNHFLSNVVGLHFIAAALPETATAVDWMKFAAAAVQKEIDVQVLPDGADFESSIPYHRLVIELFLGSFRLAQHLNQPFSEHFKRRLEDMVEYLIGVLLPSGEMPTLGDADDGRLMVATDYGTWNRKDPRHLLAPAALTLGRLDWLEYAPVQSGWEALWWGFDGSRIDAAGRPPPDNARLYPNAGVAISRRRDHGRFLMVTNSIVGTVGFGNHKNNDQLSFEYHDEGQPLIVDPGSYVYTSDFAARNLFRGTAYHNTVQIDGVEQNEFNPSGFFGCSKRPLRSMSRFDETDGIVTYEGYHKGYETQLSQPVRHTRRFAHRLDDGRLEIVDVLSGSGVHELCWNFHFHPSVHAELCAPEAVRLEDAGRPMATVLERGIGSSTRSIRGGFPHRTVFESRRLRCGFIDPTQRSVRTSGASSWCGSHDDCGFLWIGRRG